MIAAPTFVTSTLRDGTQVRVRPVTRADQNQLVRGFRDLSEASRYQRFFSPVTRLTTGQLR